jgi:hypothetical protein
MITMNQILDQYNDRASANTKPVARASLSMSPSAASMWRLNAVIMQAKLASAETLNELLLPRTRRGWFV